MEAHAGTTSAPTTLTTLNRACGPLTLGKGQIRSDQMLFFLDFFKEILSLSNPVDLLCFFRDCLLLFSTDIDAALITLLKPSQNVFVFQHVSPFFTSISVNTAVTLSPTCSERVT